MRRLLTLLLGLVLVLPVALPALPVAADTAGPAAPAAVLPPEYELVATTPLLKLHIERTSSKIIVEDTRNGKLWTSNPLEPPQGDQKSLLDDAVFLLNYTNARRQMTNLASSASEKPDLRYEPIPNGVRTTFDISGRKITLALEFTIKDNYLEVKIPDAPIKEEGEFKIVTVEVLPLFGAAATEADGYLVIPDGSGGIVRYRHEHPQYRQRYSATVFGGDLASASFTQTATGSSARWTSWVERPYMPIWGLVDGQTGYLGIITQGEYEANINGYMSGYITNYSRASAEFQFRRQAAIPRRRTLMVNRIEEDRLTGDRSVRYTLLTGNEASYVGIANNYRKYLVQEKQVARIKQEPRAYLQLFMAITRKTGFREDRIPMTTYAQAREIVQGFLDRGVKNLDVALIGWTDEGLRGTWPRRYPSDWSIGGNDGLRDFVNFAHKNGVRVILEDDYLLAYTASTGQLIGQVPFLRNLWPAWSYGFTAQVDTMRAVNRLPLGDRAGSRGGGSRFGLYLLNARVMYDRYVQRDVPIHKSFGIDGVQLRYYARFLPSDTNPRYPMRRHETAQQYRTSIDYIRKTLGTIAVDGANHYALGHADRTMEVPLGATDAFVDDDVPLYHMVSHGLTTGTVPGGNHRNDPQLEFLRHVEWGIQPSFFLSYQSSAQLIRTSANRFFSTQWTTWIDRAAQEFLVMERDLGHTWSQFMVDHQPLAQDVFQTTYEDGTRVFVNYGAQAFTTDRGVTVGALDYKVIKP